MATATTGSASIPGSATTYIYRDTNTNASNSAAVGSTQTVVLVNVDNRLNTTEDVYFKIYDAAGPTIGTTEPDTIVRCRKGERIELGYTGTGYVLGTALSFVATQEAGKPAEVNTSTNPSSNVVASVAVSQA